MSTKHPTLPTPPLVIRGRSPELVPFVTASWMRGSKHAEQFVGVPHEVFAHHHHQSIERLWNDPGATWLFAAHEPDPNFVFGWLLGEATDQGPVLHWVYVRNSMRGMGVSRALLASFLHGQVEQRGELGERPRAFHSMSTSLWRSHLRDAESAPFKGWAWLYDPWLLDRQPFHRTGR